MSDRPPGLHIVTGAPFQDLEAVRHDDGHAAQPMKRTIAEQPDPQCG